MSDSEKTLGWILKGGLLATPFIVFIVTHPLYFPFITGKNFIFRILVELLGVVWVYAAVRFPRFRPRFSALTLSVTVFIAAMGVATVLSISPAKSFWSNFERMEGYVGLLHLFLYFLLLGSVFRTSRDWDGFFKTSLFASALVSGYVLLQLIGALAIHQGGTRVDATFGNATYLAAYILFHLFFLVWYFLRTPRPAWRVTYGALFILELIVLYYTATRGAILGLIGGFLILAFLLVVWGRGFARRLAAAGLAVFVLVPVAFFMVKDTAFVRSSPVLERFATISPSETTTRARFAIWRMAIAGWRERPVTGWGQENFTYVFSKYYDPSLWSQEPWFDRAHNVLLDWLIAGGALGLASYLGIFAAAAWLLLRSLRLGALDLAAFAVFASLLAAHFFQILFVFDNLTTYLLFFAVLAYIHAITRQVVERPAREGSSLAASVVAGAAALMMLPLIYLGNIRPIRAAGDILDALKLAQSHQPAGRVDAVIGAFEHGIKRGTFGTTELREQAGQAYVLLSRDPAIAQQDRQKYAAFVVRELEEQVREYPHDMRAKAFLATLYNSAGRPADSVRMAYEAIALNPRRQQFHFVAAEAFLTAGEHANAIKHLKQAHELAPEYREAADNLGLALILAGRFSEAEDFFLKYYGTRVPVNENFARAYDQRGSFERSLVIWQEIVRTNPKNAQYHVGHGIALARTGRTEEAVRAVEEAIRHEPQFKSNGIELIKAIRAGRLTPQ